MKINFFSKNPNVLNAERNSRTKQSYRTTIPQNIQLKFFITHRNWLTCLLVKIVTPNYSVKVKFCIIKIF